MTSLNSILLTSLSGMRVSQTSMGVVSQNIANASTAGYVRTEVLSNARPGSGVEISSIQRAADRFLAAASYAAEASHSAAAARSDILTRAQANFGDPSNGASLFATIDGFWSTISDLGVDPSSTLRRDETVSALQTMYSEIQRVGGSLQSLITEADQRIGEAVTTAQDLINRIHDLNKEIQLSQNTTGDPTGAQNAQAALINELSALMDIRVETRAEGGVHIRTSGGALLVGVSPAALSYTPSSAPFGTHGVIQINPDLGSNSNLEPYISGGEIAGLIQARDVDLPNLAESLGGFAAVLADSLNEVHNQNSSSPAVGSFTGRQTGLLGTDALNFTGTSVIGVVNAGGVLTQRLTIDFDNGTITGENPATVYNFNQTIDDFATALDTALNDAGGGSADFTQGVLSLEVGSGNGLVIQDPDDPSVASDRAGRGFSHFFGLNDLVSRPTPLFFDTGVTGGEAHGFTEGEIVYQVRDSHGRIVAQPTLDIQAAGLDAPGSDWDDIVAALNAQAGAYGSFSLGATGQITFQPASGYKVALVSDSTDRGGTGVSLTALHGLSAQATAGRALELNVDAEIVAAPVRLAVGRPDLTAALNTQIIEEGDGRGSAALLAARDATRTFPAAGGQASQTTSLAVYASRLAGEAGRMASDAKRVASGAAAVASAAADRRSEVESVSLDDELLKMTAYQNAYSASARVIQAVTEMFDVLLSTGRY
ncbi:MAG: flagellar hook-associated protein FlgK [Hyphomonadaceae bacterium]|nr:flagellar hook-associated protein FlgK [Hyphomonadaceae bacterium]